MTCIIRLQCLRFLKREHLIDVTEVFRALKREKYFRLAKLIFYLLLFLIVIFRIIMVAEMKSVFDSAPEDIDIRSSVLEY
ncbi:protein cornichon-like protein 1 isoform X1 [Cucumis melo var. makuwa]|uniref:Protein cornichon-like protein 1 isoform X1 n=1 Tax=Cucumis melo var. makuwa TaxID=1194695 RepID=A0A5A7T2J2_CUCMM|nr:protein cornichon-like protein 1 isoform X1 [Cucumis melo var. makuwa]